MALGLQAQESPDLSDGYLKPSDEIADEILAPRHLNVTLTHLDPGGELFFNQKEAGIMPLSYLGKPHYNIAGLQIDWKANRHRDLTTDDAATALELIDAHSGEISETIQSPDGAYIGEAFWSPDGNKIAWLAHFDDESHVYVTDVENGRSVQVTDQPLLATLVRSVEWSADGRYLFAVILPDGRTEEPEAPQTTDVIKVRRTSPEENRLRTYPSLLEDQHEANLLEYYITGQLARIDLQEESVEPIGEPAMIREIDASPSGEYVIVQTIQKPFSYIVPVRNYSWNEEIWDVEGNVLTELRHSKASEGVEDGDVLEDYGREEIQWRPDGEGLSLLITPEEDKEENSEEEENEDEEKSKEPSRVVQWLAPFGEDDMETIYESDEELRSVSYSSEGDVLFLTEKAKGKERVYAFYPEEPDTTYTIAEYDPDEFYENPGNLLEKAGPFGEYVVRISPDDQSVFLSGTEYFENVEEQAPRPFIDRVEIRTGETERIFQSSEDMYEQVRAVLDDAITEIVVERESAEIYPDSWLFNLETGDQTKLTDNTDYNETVTQAPRERFKVQRADGFEFWMEVVLPPDWDGEPLPGMIWHYPREYDDQEDYNEGIRRYNKNNFPGIRARSLDILIKAGYAVLLPDWPIVGRRGDPNDNFVWSIVQNSTAVIDSAASRGYVDRSRMAIGGHSYGAFGTANAMIHTSLFRAGIAGSGNYNRTLTPMGFQREPLDLWRGQDKYLQMSPLFWADRLDGAFLMYHGEEDQNVGTFPINSQRMFHALNGMGKTAVLYRYPYEAHGPAGRETLLDMWKRWVDWLDYYVKEKQPFNEKTSKKSEE